MSKPTNAEKKSETMSFRAYPHEKLTAAKLAALSQQSLNEWLYSIFHKYLAEDYQAKQWPEIVLAEIAAVRKLIEGKSVFLINETLASQLGCNGFPDDAQQEKMLIQALINSESLINVIPKTFPTGADEIINDYSTAQIDKKIMTDHGGKTKTIARELIEADQNEDETTLPVGDCLHIPVLENDILPAINTSEISAFNLPMKMATNTLMEEQSSSAHLDTPNKLMIDLNGDELLEIY